MRISSQLLLLNFLLNAVWQIAFVAALASFGAWLLRSSSARYRHWLWVSALCLAFLVPAATAIRAVIEATMTAPLTTNTPSPGGEPVQPFPLDVVESRSTGVVASIIQVNTDLVFLVLGVYGIFLLYRAFRLVQAWQTTRAIKRNALELDPDDDVASIINLCESEFDTGARRVRVLRSETLPVPVTMGLAQPAIILPDALLHERNNDLLTSAIGHEFIHVARRDYLLNFIYELLYLPISFHPAAALLRRRIKQTRELCCDELVAARILNAEVYARSLLRLAGAAPSLRRLSVSTTVGIADADILEARIMSLLTKPKLNTRWKRTLLFAVSLLLLVPCAAAAAFNLRFDLETAAQDPAQQEQRNKEVEREKQKVMEMRARSMSPADALKEKIARDPAFEAELVRRKEVELEMRAIRQAALIKLARINMDQAIQIATSQQPGKVMLATLDAKGWEEPGKLGKDGMVFYHVVIADEAVEGAQTHVFVNAVDGTLIKTEKELPRKRSPENQ
jgi:beta-lactamase regulating signal transducer with metallopeptidase domain